jgi:hypothetical protein
MPPGEGGLIFTYVWGQRGLRHFNFELPQRLREQTLAV